VYCVCVCVGWLVFVLCKLMVGCVLFVLFE
jgi:hypothetical protein